MAEAAVASNELHEPWSEDELSDDDALSLAGSLNETDDALPATERGGQRPFRLSRVLGVSSASRLGGIVHDCVVMGGSGVVWLLDRKTNTTSFLPIGAAGDGECGSDPVVATAISPGGLILCAHQAPTDRRGRLALSVWSSASIDSARCITSFWVLPKYAGVVETVGFAGGRGVPFVWFASRGQGATVRAFTWRAEDVAGEKLGGSRHAPGEARAESGAPARAPDAGRARRVERGRGLRRSRRQPAALLLRVQPGVTVLCHNSLSGLRFGKV